MLERLFYILIFIIFGLTFGFLMAKLNNFYHERSKKMIVGICCEYCIKQNQKDCPVKTADPWSRWNNFCGEWENKEGDTISTFLKPKEIVKQ